MFYGGRYSPIYDFWPSYAFSVTKKKKKISPQRSLHSRFEYSAATYFFPDCKAHSTCSPVKEIARELRSNRSSFDSSLWSSSNFNRKYPLSNVYGARSNVYANRARKRKWKKKEEWKMREIIDEESRQQSLLCADETGGGEGGE